MCKKNNNRLQWSQTDVFQHGVFNHFSGKLTHEDGLLTEFIGNINKANAHNSVITENLN